MTRLAVDGFGNELWRGNVRSTSAVTSALTIFIHHTARGTGKGVEREGGGETPGKIRHAQKKNN